MSYLHALAGKPDDALHERPAGAALRLCGGRRLEDDHVAARRVAEVVEEAIREHAIGEARLAAGRRTRAVERRLHRRRRDAVRVDDPRLDREDDRDGADDGDDPVDCDPQPARKPPGDAIERMMELVLLVLPRRPAPTEGEGPRERRRRRRRRPVVGRDHAIRRPTAVVVLRSVAGRDLALLGAAHVALLTRSRRHSSMRPWSPERRISGTVQPRNSAGRV